MAVSFKVPASPKKDIFVIDDFKGVDLTNTGSNIDENRSPNAENMVRYVPGKVRKRTGYQTKVEFTNKKDVNRALGTSDEYAEIEVTGTSFATSNVLYKINGYPIQPNLHYMADCIGTYKVGIRSSNGTGTSTTITGTEETHEREGWLWQSPSLADEEGIEIYVYKTSEGDDDYFRIKDVFVCANTSAESVDEWNEIPWTPAPEDIGCIYKECETTDPIYGCHILKSGTFEGNRVVNVNRALGTHDDFDVFTCDNTGWTRIYDLGNFIYRDAAGENWTRLYIEFDYISTGEVMVDCASVYSSSYILEDTSGGIQHYSYMYSTAGSFSTNYLSLKAVSGSQNVMIKNLSVMYEKDDNYSWTPAPEDTGATFHIEDIYNVASKNYATEKEMTLTGETSSLTRSMEMQFADATHHLDGFVKVSFDFYTTTETQVSSILVRLADDAVYLYDEGKTFTKNVNSQHLEFYVAPTRSNRYVKAMWVTFTMRTTDGNVTARISNLKLQAITPRDSYDISNKTYIYHVGKSLYSRASNSANPTLIYDNANRHLSKAWQMNEKLFILDGKNIYSYAVGDATIEPLTGGDAYIPLVTIAKSPSGGGTPYKSLNMLQPGFYEQFVVTEEEAEETEFRLSFSGLDDTKTTVWIMDEHGNWIKKTEGTDYTVDRGNGIINFSTAPGQSPVKGTDSVKVLAYRTIAGYADRISKCTIGTLFGVGGAADRLFLSGNPDYPNWDFYSEQYDPTYFPDTGYSALGSSASAIVGYAIVNNYLAALKDDFDKSQSVFIREGDWIENTELGTSEPAFRLINTLQGVGIVAPYSVGYLQTEPVFLTRSGIYAITAQDITGEKYSQNRSFYLNGALTKEDHLENAMATIYNDMYVLAINNKLYILDGLQPTRTDKSEPYATRQYVAYYCTNVPAISIWEDDQALWIGTSKGQVCKFATDIEDLNSYNDNGDPIYCCWETPDLDGKLFYKNKTFRYFAIRMMQALRTSVKLYSRKLGTWSFIKEDTASGVVFDFSAIDFELFSFSTDTSEKVAHTKVRVKKVDKARFKVENDKLNEPFGLFDLALEYVESGNYKG